MDPTVATTGELRAFYFAYGEMFVVPIEHLAPAGIDAAYRAWLLDTGRVAAAWIDLFDAAFAAYWRRVADLSQQVPAEWFPPRLQHCCVVTDPTRVRPYAQVFSNCSWVLDASDFDPVTSNVEFAAYQFLAYWLGRSDAEADEFCEACRRCVRPDGDGFRALADAMPWIRTLHHETLKPPPLGSGPWIRLSRTGMLVPPPAPVRIAALEATWQEVAATVTRGYFRNYGRPTPQTVRTVCSWFAEVQPCVLVLGRGKRPVWDPAAPDRIAGLRSELRGSGEETLRSVCADVETVAEHSRRFLASLRDPDALPLPPADMAEAGLTHLSRSHRLIAYDLHEPSTERLHAPAPPFQRFMLAARTIHEWGHVAADAGWVGVPVEQEARYKDLHMRLAELFARVVREAPDGVQAHCAADLTKLTNGDDRAVGGALAAVSLARLPDYQANLLAQLFLERNAVETYVRNNVYCLSMDTPSTAIFSRLARYVYEYQYLRFSRIGDPKRYFASSTWFGDEYWARGVVSEALFDVLVETMHRLCACHAIRWDAFVPELRARASATA